ncbi:N-acetylglucosamine-6-phosphate deacetylase [Mycobacterium shimoidei]|uniref:N-acetylglucosamine-6-phosphate deacetylase n=1 Tax=Mycobacterium shimoidei TaxID=29313 RepID=A0A1E3TIB6_MYCSH|nr:N-acetylglucosamine-6-phosphate deacetylase [Mycobacterium shimoidei]MCV7257901.1 N-acetylglucosamine-6-phosphate deacetylase [Mycobacterium shimoidei]ODR14155.1 N-acetylglucosamine-6-phosphate deacetylase [Mycobacterium shimoidei]ORW83949.1 N-acetylglucosamine-6-phosphate deacetylase [Mycobacterium shimoidei]SRX91859.1 putative N-acetylglucosamine-6-phosphate deacetylase NagA (GlcNAc 6-P deacetylase) [Mycobacterium tuberculosis H37Rv] [Mycobacterium shimoidei]
MTLICSGTMVLGRQLCRPGWVQTSGARIVDCGPGSPPRPADVDLPDAVVVPGFVDIHVHGGGGASYTNDTEIARAAQFHRRHGTTTTLASLLSASVDDLLRSVRSLAQVTRAGIVAGIHLEGPWLSAARCGAHDPTQLRDPSPTEIDALLDAGDGAIRMVTLAPERAGGFEAITRLADAGVVVAVGHTDASYQQTQHAVSLGTTVGTHLFNAMAPLHHREPGPALALLQDPRVTVELIADSVHVHPAVLRAAIDTAGPDRVALVTDATPAAGQGDGAFRLGNLDVDVTSGVARVRGTSTIAGSTATMDQLFATVAGLAADPDAGLVAAATMTSATPARALGLPDVGSLRAGRRADLVVLDRNLAVSAVMAGGEWLGDI